MVRTFEDLARDWLSPPVPLADDAVVPEFDPEAALQSAGATNQLHASLPQVQRPWWRFPDFAIRPGMGVAEAMFWLRVAADSEFSPATAVRWRFHSHDALARYPESMPTRSDLEALVVRAMGNGGDAVPAWLVPLIGLRQVVEWFLSGRLTELATKGGCWYFSSYMIGIAPRLPTLVRPAEWRATLEALGEHLDPTNWCSVQTANGGMWNNVHPAWRLAGALGHVEPLRALIESWPDDVWLSPGWLNDHGMDFVCQVRDAGFSQRHLPRLQLRPHTPSQVGVWLLHTGDQMLDPVLELARRAASRDEAASVVRWLGEYGSDEALVRLLELAHKRGPAQQAANGWVTDHPGRMIEVCARIVAGGGERGSLAGEHLHRLWSGAAGRQVEACIQGHGVGPLAERLDAWRKERAEEVGLAELPSAPSMTGKVKPLPDWLDISALSPLRCDGRRLSPEVVRGILMLLRNGITRHPCMSWARAGVSAESREVFWQALVTEWGCAGTGKKDNWCLSAAVALRGPATASNLARLIMAWPTESQHQKAALGLECLRAMGDAPALQALVGIAQRTRLAGLRGRAEACVAEIAAELGLTPEELADTSVPTCGFDQAGRREFDFGPRRFTAEVLMGGGLQLKAGDGRVLKALPKPSASDDMAMAGQAIKEWKAMKKMFADTLKTQRQRLEQSLMMGRCWAPVNFERYITAHPVMRSLASTLAWGIFDSEGVLRGSLWIAREDGRMFAPDGSPVVLEGDVHVGLVHPMQLDAESWSRWRQWLKALGCEQAVSQLGRETERVSESEKGSVFLAEFSDRKMEGATLRRRMDGMAWRRGVPVDAGLFYEYVMPFSAAGVTAVVETSGQSVVTSYDSGQVEVKRVFFVSGSYDPVAYTKHEHALPLGLVDDVALSETVRALRHALRVARVE